MNQSTIMKMIPHRPPMLLVDGITDQSDTAITCHKTFHSDEFFFQGHYPDNPIVPGVILCEAAMQTGAILLARFAEEGGTPVATRMNDVRFKKIVRPGDTIEITATLDEQLANAFFLRAKVLLDGKLAARLEFACTLVANEA